jgi:hypothetical protein
LSEFIGDRGRESWRWVSGFFAAELIFVTIITFIKSSAFSRIGYFTKMRQNHKRTAKGDSTKGTFQTQGTNFLA